MGNHLPVKKGLSASIPKPWVRYDLEDSPLCLFCYVVSAPSGNDDNPCTLDLVHRVCVQVPTVSGKESNSNPLTLTAPNYSSPPPFYQRNLPGVVLSVKKKRT